MFSLNKKGTGSLWDVIVWAVIVLVVAVLLIIAFNNLFGKEVGIIGTELMNTGDYDGDSAADRFDQCPCVFGEALNGCPSGRKPATTAERFNPCPQSICEKWGLKGKELDQCKGG